MGQSSLVSCINVTESNSIRISRAAIRNLRARAGTENVPAIAGFAKAVEIDNSEEKQRRRDRYYGFKKQLTDGLKANHIEFEINGKMIAVANYRMF